MHFYAFLLLLSCLGLFLQKKSLDNQENDSICQQSFRNMITIRLGLIWSKFSDPKSSDTTFAFLNGDYKNAFSFFLLLQKARSQRFEVYIVTLLKRKPPKMKIFNNFVKNGSIIKFSKLSDPLRPNGSLNNKKLI